MERRTFIGIVSTLAISSKIFGVEKAAKNAANIKTSAPSFIDKTKCIHCGTCYKNCPVKAITKEVVDKVDTYTVDTKKCISCGTCLKRCPVKAISWKSNASIQTNDSLKTISEGKKK